MKSGREPGYDGLNRGDIDVPAVLGLDPDTVARYSDATKAEHLLVTRHRASKLDPFKDYVDSRWNERAVWMRSA